jgi:hypothetical protein
MFTDIKDRHESGTSTTAAKRKVVALILILIVDAGYIAWGGMAALAPDHLLGPGSVPILAAEYKGFTGHSWSELASASPMTTAFVTVIYRVYGAYNVVFGLMAGAIALTAFRRGDRWAWWTLLVGHTIALGSAMKFDWTMNAIGPFEMTEYLGLVLIYTALAITASFAAGLPFSAQRGTV